MQWLEFVSIFLSEYTFWAQCFISMYCCSFKFYNIFFFFKTFFNCRVCIVRWHFFSTGISKDFSECWLLVFPDSFLVVSILCYVVSVVLFLISPSCCCLVALSWFVVFFLIHWFVFYFPEAVVNYLLLFFLISICCFPLIVDSLYFSVLLFLVIAQLLQCFLFCCFIFWLFNYIYNS